MNMRKKMVFGILVLAFAGQVPFISAAELYDQQLINDARATVDTPASGLLVTAPFTNNLAVMSVRVFNQKGDMVLNYRSLGETVELPAADLPDGDYRYEAVSVFLLDVPVGEGPDYTDEGISRKNGRFTIKDRALFQPDTSRIEERRLQDELSFKDTMINHATAALAFVLSPFVSDAAADTFTKVEIQSSYPYLEFDDTDSPSTWDWDVYGVANPTDNDGHFLIEDWLGNSNQAVLDFHSTGNSNALRDSIVVESNGDIYWGNSGMYFDRSQQQLSIGTLSNSYELNISSLAPDIYLHDETETAGALLQVNSTAYRIWGRMTSAQSFDDIVEVHLNAPDNTLLIDSPGVVNIGATRSTGSHGLRLGNTATDRAEMMFQSAEGTACLEFGQGNQFQIEGNCSNTTLGIAGNAPHNSLIIDGSGNVGLGTASPNANLNVVGGNTAQIRVNNTTVSPPAGDQVMFQLQSAATNKVRFMIMNPNGTWTFDNGGSNFEINRFGTGVNEFRVESDGDIRALKNSYAVNHINTSSRDSKTDFASIDEIAILEKLSEMPMSTWRYKVETENERHLGPVAEDFQLAFGLSDGKHISTVDASGVDLTAIKGLNKVLQKRTVEIVALRQANSDLQNANSELVSANQALDDRLTRLENVLFRENEVAVR